MNQWATHTGAMPPTVILEGSTLLDWIGPVWAAEQSSGARAGIELSIHSAEDIGQMMMPSAAQEIPQSLKALCERRSIGERRPIGPAGSTHETGDLAGDVIKRLTFSYPFEPATRQMATASVTSIAKGSGSSEIAARGIGPVPANLGEPAAIRASKPAGTGLGAAEGLGLPAFMSAGPVKLGATDIGDATHLALQYLRFVSATDAAGIVLQLDQMLFDKKLSDDQRKAVDVATIEWFVHTPLGRLVTENESRLMRELPVYFSAPPAQVQADLAGMPGGLDLMMVRGRLDLLVPLPAGGILIDYKTDNVRTDEQMAQRVATYREQLNQYAEALRRITGQPIARRCLVFLAARQVVDV